MHGEYSKEQVGAAISDALREYVLTGKECFAECRQLVAGLSLLPGGGVSGDGEHSVTHPVPERDGKEGAGAVGWVRRAD